MKAGNDYIYELKDYLGNVRQTIKEVGNVQTWASTVASYYPFGLKFNESVNSYRYEYQGEYAEEERRMQ